MVLESTESQENHDNLKANNNTEFVPIVPVSVIILFQNYFQLIENESEHENSRIFQHSC